MAAVFPGPGSRVESWAAPIVLVALWFVLTPRVIPELRFPSPASVLEALHALGWQLAVNAGATWFRTISGWLIGVVLGTLLGLRMSRNPRLERLTHPLLEVLRPLPPVALVPFFIIWFGVGAVGQVVLIALSAFMVLAVTTYAAVQTVPKIYIQAAACLGADADRVYRTVIIPAILPTLVAGLRVAAGVSFGVAVAAEFMGAQSGLGYMVMVARRTLHTNTILIGLVVVGMESFVVDAMLRFAARKALPWTDTPTDSISLLNTSLDRRHT